MVNRLVENTKSAGGMQHAGTAPLRTDVGGCAIAFVPAITFMLRDKAENAVLMGDMAKIREVVGDAIKYGVLRPMLNSRNGEGKTLLALAKEWPVPDAIVAYLEDLGAQA